MGCYILLRQKPSPLLNFEFPQNYEAISRTKGFNGKNWTKGKTNGKMEMVEINQRLKQG